MLISELFTILPKSKHSASYGKSAGKYPFFTSSNTVDSFVDEPDFDGEYLIIGDGGTGNSKYINGKFSVSDHNYVLKPRNNTNPRAVNYFLKKDGYRILNEGFKGIGIKNVSKSYIESIDYRFNSKFAESQIVANLDKINNAIGLEKHILFELDSLIKSRFNEMFSFCKTTKSVGELAKICRGASPRPIQSYITNKPSGINWIKIGDAKDDDMFISSTSEKITPEGALKSREVKIGDFILSNSMSFGKPYILKIDGCVHDGWLIISDYEKYLNPIYFYYELRSNDVQSQFNGSASGTTVRNLNSDLVRKTLIKLPSLDLQNTFASFVEKVDKLKFNAQERIKLYQELLNKKMDEYFG